MAGGGPLRDDAARIAGWRDALDRAWGPAPSPTRRTPVGQLVKSLISGRTRDAASVAAYRALRGRFGSAAGVAAADPAAVEAALAAVTFPDAKARHLVAALRAVGAERPDFRLDFLRDLPMADALAWLERLPGVGRKTAAAVMNFSTIDRPVLAADGHVARVLGRLGLGTADPARASERVTAAMPGWGAGDFRTFHVQLKRVGKTLCHPRAPDCPACPLRPLCATGRAASPGPAPRAPL